MCVDKEVETGYDRCNRDQMASGRRMEMIWSGAFSQLLIDLAKGLIGGMKLMFRG